MPFASVLHHARALERWALPAECLLCREAVPASAGDALVCPLCRSRWRPIPDPLCRRCGQPIRRDLECLICPNWPDALTAVRSAVWLEDNARDLVHHLKYEGWWRAAEAMAHAMRNLEPLAQPGLLVPLPLSTKRLKARGYNQAERIAAVLGRLRGRPVRAEALIRRRDTRTQTALTPEERRANVEGAFEARGVRGQRVLVVDDVFTTGATLVSAAAALREAGATVVEAVTFARAVLPVR